MSGGPASYGTHPSVGRWPVGRVSSDIKGSHSLWQPLALSHPPGTPRASRAPFRRGRLCWKLAVMLPREAPGPQVRGARCPPAVCSEGPGRGREFGRRILLRAWPGVTCAGGSGEPSSPRPSGAPWLWARETHTRRNLGRAAQGFVCIPGQMCCRYFWKQPGFLGRWL